MKSDNNKGFTLVEVVLTLAIFAMIIGIIFSIFNMSSRPHDIISREYQLQSNLRITSQKLTNTIKKASAIFALKKVEPIFTLDIFPETNGSNDLIVIDDNFINNSSNKNELEAAINKYEGWSFITLNSDGKELREFIYHKEKGYYTMQRIIEKQSIGESDVVYEIEFKKNNLYTDDNLIEYSIIGHLEGVEKDFKIEPINIKSQVEALNSLQVVDKGDYKSRATALFYRTEDRPMGEDIEAAVTMVLDISGSMAEDMNGNLNASSNPNDSNASRISILRQKANDLVNKMATLDNINMNLIPFNYKSYGQWMRLPQGYVRLDKFYNAKNEKHLLNSIINHLEPNGGTNIGDGIRRAYYRLNGYPNKDSNKYMILLMDGVPTFGSVYRASRYSIWFSDFVGNSREYNGKKYYYRSKGYDGYNYEIYLYTTYYNVDFVINDIDISDEYGNVSEHPYDGQYYRGGRYAGLGNVSDDYISKPYILEIAKKLENIKNNQGEKNLKVFVIGFSNVQEEKEELEFLKNELAKHAKQVTAYDVKDSEGLEKVFNDINQIILDDLWHITGPQE